MAEQTEVQRLSRRLQARSTLPRRPAEERTSVWDVPRPRITLGVGLAMLASGAFQVLTGDSHGWSGELFGVCGLAQVVLATTSLVRHRPRPASTAEDARG